MTEDEARRPGRPRSAEADRAILEATVELLGEHGIRGLSIEAVAARAGVGKTTIYRRWKSKEELIVAAASLLRPSEVPAEQGSLIEDLRALVTIQRERLANSSIPRVMPRILPEAMEDPELHRTIVEQAVEPIRDIIRTIVQRAIDRGELRDDVDVEAVVDMLHALPIYTLLMGGADMSRVAEVPDRYVPLLLEGLSSSSAGRASARRRSSGSSRARRARSG
jgi:AcrR family transcriptional regulator